MAETCANCGTTLTGKFCAQCGQDANVHRRSVGELIGHAADEFFGFESRTLRTIRLLLTAPGFLTAEFIAGRRQPYVPALRLYFFLAVAFFVALSMFGIAIVQLQPYTPGVDPPASYISVQNDAAGEVAGRVLWFRPLQHVTLTAAQRTALERMKENLESQGDVASAKYGDKVIHLLMNAYADSNAFNTGVQAWTSRFLLLMMPLFALFTAVLVGGRFFIVDHLTFALHYHSFLFIALAAAVAIAALAPGTVAYVTTLAILALYLFLSLRRAYGLSFVGTAWRTALLLAVYLSVFTYGLQAAILLTMS